MADLAFRFRTNYFHVMDVPAFLRLMRTADFTLENSKLWLARGPKGDAVYAFGSEEGILSDCTDNAVILLSKYGYREDFPIRDNDEKWSEYNSRLSEWCKANEIDFGACEYAEYDEASKSLIEQLQKLLPMDDLIVITEIGCQKLQYLWGDVQVITRTDVQYVSLESAARDMCEKMMESQNRTKVDN